MTIHRFRTLAAGYPKLRVAVVGDFCLDRYLEIDPHRAETSIETGLPVHNVVRVRAQPGGAGTILNNLVALGVGMIYPVGFSGDDGEGFELRRALSQGRGIDVGHFLTTSHRSTFTYCKPLVVSGSKPPVELNRLDTKNWSSTPRALEEQLVGHLQEVAGKVDALIVLDQVSIPETGVITRRMIDGLAALGAHKPGLLILADSRQGLAGFSGVSLKMNLEELQILTRKQGLSQLEQAEEAAGALARERQRLVFVTCAEKGIIGASPEGEPVHAPAMPVTGPIDIVGAGDAVTANLASALAMGATLRESLEIANAAASVVIHKLGTTGSATPQEIERVLNTVESAG